MNAGATPPPLQAGKVIDLRPAFGLELRLAAIATPPTNFRESARRLCRHALREMLAEGLACPPETIRLSGEPGQPLRVDGYPAIGLSLSHERGLSLVAIHFAGPVGVDLVCIDEVPAVAADLDTLCRDYLGPGMAAILAATPADARQRAFAQAWAAHEARLKCLGLGLEEWSAALEGELALTVTRPLALPDGHAGAFAVRQPG